MNYGKPKPINNKGILDGVLKHLKRASEMPYPGDPAIEHGVQYKACDENGKVFIVTHPCTWPITYPVGKQAKRHRPQPIEYDAAKHESQPLPAPSGRTQSEQRGIEW